MLLWAVLAIGGPNLVKNQTFPGHAVFMGSRKRKAMVQARNHICTANVRAQSRKHTVNVPVRSPKGTANVQAWSRKHRAKVQGRSHKHVGDRSIIRTEFQNPNNLS